MKEKFQTKRSLKRELAETKSDLLYYRNKLCMIEVKLREQKETGKNGYTTLREISNIMYYEEGVSDKEDFNGN